jgi:allantoinase
MASLVVRSERVVLPGRIRPAAVHVRDGRIVSVADHGSVPADVPLLDAGENVVLPGLVDSHVHINDPGRAEWEGFDHATLAAAAGGVTTIVDMPLNSIPATTSREALSAKRAAAENRCHVDVGFWGGLVPGNISHLGDLARDGVLGFKCFLCPSGVEEFEHVTEEDLRAAMPILGELGLPLLAHAELPDRLVPPQPGHDPRRYDTWLRTRPESSEQAAIDLLLRLAAPHAVRLHIVHLSAASSLASLGAARAAGQPVTVETCPHYLAFAAEEIEDGATALKCAPPIRTASNRERLWAALVSGDIDLVATDHSPAPPDLKCLDTGDFVAAWGGVSSLQLGLSVLWAEASRRGVPLDRVVMWLSAAPARLAGLASRKGAIAVGLDADLVIWDPDAEWVVDPSVLHHRHPVTPYAGRTVRGRVLKTLLRGVTVFDEGRFVAAPHGQLI